MGFRPIDQGGESAPQPNPSRLCAYLPSTDTYTTPPLLAGVSKKVFPPFTLKSNQNFVEDGVNERFTLSEPGVTDKLFTFTASMSVSSSTSNHLVVFEVYKNGSLEEGIGAARWIAAGTDTGATSVTGAISLSHGDYVEFHVKSETDSTITFTYTSVTIIEVVGAA